MVGSELATISTSMPAVLIEPDELFEDGASESRLVSLFKDYYAKDLERVNTLASYAGLSISTNTLMHFVKGNIGSGGPGREMAARLFGLEGAVKHLDATYWRLALDLTDVYQMMNQDRRNEWDKQIEEMATPPFSPVNVSTTIGDLLARRGEFLAERVDGFFRALSGAHVTNRPQGFSKRMILEWITDSYGSSNVQRVGYISDLRAVVAKFMGREEPRWHSTSRLVEMARSEQPGKWMDLDGGALRIRCYLKGTAHLEVHPDMAWRLNAILAHRYPKAIAAEWRKKPSKPSKEWPLIQRPIRAEVLEVITDLLRRGGSTAFQLGFVSMDNRREQINHRDAMEVISYLGGVAERGWVRFDYDAAEVLRRVASFGCIPDEVSHQYYPTPEKVARLAVELAEITDAHSVLEPSAGMGALADHLPNKGAVVCVEQSPLHAAVLRAKGYSVREEDFLRYAKHPPRFERVVMNPPYSGRRWEDHLVAAAGCLAPGGILVAILPASAAGSARVANFFEREGFLPPAWTRPIANEFEGTSISVAIVAARKGE